MIPQITERIYSDINSMIFEMYNVVGCIDGHVKTQGKDAYYMKNPLWVIEENGEEFILMYCEPESLVKLCKKSFSIIKEYEMFYEDYITWYVGQNGYVSTKLPKTTQNIYIHQLIMECFGNGRGTATVSVDHIDRDPLNNTLSNLRIATREEQNNNQKGVIAGTKRERQHQARELPEGVTQEDMPKYMNYNVNVWDKEKNKSRDFFRIERHPLLFPKVWEGTKSMKVSIQDKLEQAKKVLQELDNGVLPTHSERDLPKYVYFTSMYENPYLVYDNRNTKHTKQMRIKDELFDINNPEKREKQVYIFNHIIMKTYGEDASVLPEESEYCGEPIDEKELHDVCFQLPKYVCLLNEAGNTILAFHRIVDKKTLNKKMKLPNNYNLEELSIPLLEDIETVIPLLNKEIIKKYGSEYAIIEVTEECIKNIMKEKEEDHKNGFPMYVRIQSFQNDAYLVFNKVVEKIRYNTTMKLPHNYNKNNELHNFNKKIIEVYGEAHKLDLTNYPHEDTEKIIIPENMYVVLNSKSPYMFIVKNNTSIVHTLPERYDLQSEINTFYGNENPIYTTQSEEWKPKNISIITKDGKPTLLYQKRCDGQKHSISISLPSAPFDIYLYLLKMNTRITSKYGKEHSIFHIPE